MKIILPGGATIYLEGSFVLYNMSGHPITGVLSDAPVEFRSVPNTNRNYDWRPVKDGKLVNQQQFNEGITVLEEFVKTLDLGDSYPAPGRGNYRDLGLINYCMINAIKVVREKTNSGLKEAKEFVDFVALRQLQQEVGTDCNPSRVKQVLYHFQSKPGNVERSYRAVPITDSYGNAVPESDFWAAKVLARVWGIPVLKN